MQESEFTKLLERVGRVTERMGRPELCIKVDTFGRFHHRVCPPCRTCANPPIFARIRKAH